MQSTATISLPPRPGALVATQVSRRMRALFPWIMLDENRPLEMILEPGDSYVHRESPRLFQWRKANGNVRTFTDQFDMRVSPPEFELIFRIDARMNGPEVCVYGDRLDFTDSGFNVSREALFERFAKAVLSPVWNPLGPILDASRITTHRVNFEAGTVTEIDGQPLVQPVERNFPIETYIQLSGELTGQYKQDEPEVMSPGIYRVKPYIFAEDGRSIRSYRLDGVTDEVAIFMRMVVPVEDFEAAQARGHIEILQTEGWKAFPMWEYTI